MDTDKKLDLLLQLVEGNEKKRVEADERTRAEYLDLKRTVEARIPVVEKKVDKLGAAFQELSTKVDVLESKICPTSPKQEPVTAAARGFSPLTPGMRDPNPTSSPNYFCESSARNSGGSGTLDVSGSVPPMTCPQFNGDNPQMWKANCEQYFDVYGTHPVNWVKIATLNFVGNAAFWLQSVRSQMGGISWNGLCDAVCTRFAKDKHQALIRQWIRIVQTGTVSEYVEKFDGLMHQMIAYDPSLIPVYFVTKFIEGLKDEVRVVVLVQRPQDLDTACAIALLQEEAMEGVKSASPKRSEPTFGIKSNRMMSNYSVPTSTKTTNVTAEDRRGTEAARARDEKLAALKSYRRAKGLCFTCGEKWGKEHKCASAIQLHVVEELLEALTLGYESESDPKSEDTEDSQHGTLLSISQQAVWGTESSRTIKLRGWIQDMELLMLVDSGSTHSFIDSEVSLRLPGVHKLQTPLTVRIADGGTMKCTHEISSCNWWMQGNQFCNSFRVLPLGNYDIILGMDWLELFSPMQVDWANKWMEFLYQGKLVRLQGILPKSVQCSSITNHQLCGLNRLGSLSYLVQLQSVTHEENSSVPEAVKEIIQDFHDIFQEPEGLPPRRACDHTINLIPGAKPINLRPYRHNPALKDEIEKQITEMLSSGVIQHSQSPFSSPAILVKKKDGTWRLVIDYRQLNNITVKTKYPVPVIEELLDELTGAKWFTKLDLRSGYHQIRMAEGEEPKTAFQTHSGHYEYKVMSFGLTGAPATFLKAMNDTLKSVLRKFALVFFDDILIYSPTLSSHLEHLKQVLQLLRNHHWKVKLSKCSFGQQQLSYLGHIIGVNGVATDPSKVQDVLDWAVPVSTKKLRGFLGLAGYYRKFVKNFGIISKPLTQLLRKGVPYVWTTETDNAFNTLKQALASAPVLALPNFQKTFTVETDASDCGIGAVLSQDKHPIAYVSKALGPRTRGLSTYEKECMAILLAVDHWRSYLQHGEFIILTDHHSLMHLSDQRLHTPWQHKAFTKLLGLQYKICYRKGSSNAAADALSRKFQDSDSEILAISSSVPQWLMEATQGYEKDAQAAKLLSTLAIHSEKHIHYFLDNGIIRYKNRIWVGNNPELQLKLIRELHASPAGGHSGFPVTYRKIKQLFAWPNMKKMIKESVQSCQACLQAKPDRLKYPGLLQPLPVPEGSWQAVSLDFTEGLPKSAGYNCILVVVDRFSKYAHFVALKHPFTAIDVAQAYMFHIYKLHGLPQTIVSDRDKIFTNQLWEQLFLRAGTKLHYSSAYHPQSDGQTERVNQCLEIYLRCFVHSTPSKWYSWLHLAEYWYNSTYHSSLGTTPFEVLYGYPPNHFGISSRDCAIP